MFLIISSICVCLFQSKWVMVDSSFGQGFTNNSWILSIKCDPINNFVDKDENNTCTENSIKYVRLKKDNARMDKIIMKKSFQSQVIVDNFFDDFSDGSKKAYFTLNYSVSSAQSYKMQFRYYFKVDLTQNSRRICNSTGSGNFDFITYVGNSPIQYQEKFNISIGIESENDQQLVGVRNLFVYVKFCQQTCQTCSSSTSCDTCYFGSPQANGFCLCDPEHQFAQIGVGCRQECERDYFIARSDNVCVPDRRIKSSQKYFDSSTLTSYSPFLFVTDSLNLRSSPPTLIYTCGSTNYVGSLIYGEGMSWSFASAQNLKFIRLRVTFFLQNFLTNNRIQIILDDQIQGEIIKSSSTFDFNQIKKIFSSSTICSTYEIVRIEAILRIYSSTPKLILKGSGLTQDTSIWGFRNVTIDYGNCKENCAVCASFSTCSQCATNYVLFQGGCVSSCPVHSSNCIDYADIIPYSRYLAKGFYNLNMTTDDINLFYSETIPTGSNFLTGQKFSIFPTKFVLGGVMVWNNAIYKKSWIISKPHYAVTIRFNVTYGDLYAGNFYYTVQGVKSSAHPVPTSGGQNIIGKILVDRIKYFEIFQQFTLSPLNIEFECTDTTANPIDQFCAVSDYFIVVHYCLPFCANCIDGTTCTNWESSECLPNQFLYLDPDTETYSCITCNQPGCLACNNLDECTSCDSTSSYDTLINGVCLSLTPSTSNPTIQCNIYCETCTGNLINNCLTCVSDYHRSLQHNQCLCQTGFYDNEINLYCLPICGDLLIVDGEDCDDGNYNPFDGCHNCKLGCDAFCKECLEGFCYDCQEGYQLINYKCYEIFSDNIIGNIAQCQNQILESFNCNFNLFSYFNGNHIISNQFIQCQDSNLIAQDGCFQGSFDCPQFCLSCVYGACQQCDKISGYGQLDKFNNKCISICGDGIKSIEEDCDDGNDINYDGCFQCVYQCHLNCQDCFKGICKQCQSGYYLNQKDYSCYSICGDGIIANNEQCDVLNMLENYECSNCQIKCQSECLSCYEGLCYSCKGIGWNIDIVSRQCISICGDGIIVGQEQCDDGNDIDQDGCYQCEFQCQQQCTKCLLGVCQECDSQGWYLLQNNCISQCGDQVVVENEDCDDGNEIQYDGCFECQFQCQIECIDCRQGICYECVSQGYYLTNGFCHSICGDGIVVQSYEECDDGNSLMYDGCYQCQFQCQEMCTMCQLGICYECNQFGWIIENHICKPFCGDGIIIDSEQCDDMNNNINDGCHLCQFQCDQYCIHCLEGICQQCELGRYLFQNVCYSQCGDGNYVKTAEQCDDGNQDNGDGCDKNCSIENNFTCKNLEGSYSQCVYSKYPQSQIIVFPTQFGEYQDIQIKFDQKMKYLDDPSSPLVISTIIDMNDSDYAITAQIIKSDPQNEISDIIIQLRVNFYTPIDRPILKIQFSKDKFVSQYDLPLEQTVKTIQLQSPTVLNQSQINVAQSAATYNEAVIYFLTSLSLLCLIVGSSELFWNLMDQLQYLSYVKYISIQFPPNLNIYFEIFKIISIEPIIDNIGINKIFNLIYEEEFDQIPNDGKFLNDGINVNFLENFKSFLFCLTTAFMAYYFSRIIYLILSKFQTQLLSKMNLTSTKLYFSIRQQCLLLSKDFFYNGILRVVMSNAYDISFAMTVQIAYFSNNSFRASITSYFSLVVFTSYICTSIYFVNILQKFSTSNTLKVKEKYAALFEGIKNPKNAWVAQYNAILLIKKFFFINLIVFLQKEGKIQSLLVATNQTLFLFYFVVNKPLHNYREYQKIIITESIIIFNTITFILYDYITNIGLSQNIRIIIGWVHIFTFSAILSISLIIDFFQQSQFLLKKIRESICDKKKQVEPGVSATIFI